MSREAAIVWSAIAEPMDVDASALVHVLGPADALAWVRRAATAPDAARRALDLPDATAARVLEGVARWVPRLEAADPARLLGRARDLGARVLVPGDADWPASMALLEPHVPFALWMRGARLDLKAAWERSLAVVGARACTAYGERCAAEIGALAADRGYTLVSGGAYGIDAAAHRGAVAAGGVSVAVLAGGVDRLYPAGNDALLRRVMEAGAVVSEQPPGYAPYRSRFLTRNRLIATARATVVVEASARSGALSTARHANVIVRPVGAVPGPVTSAASRGCHALIRDGLAVLVSEPRDAIELAAAIGAEPESSVAGGDAARTDFATQDERRAYDALGRRGATADAVAVAAGLGAGETLRALGGLAARGLAHREQGRWRRTPPGGRGDHSDIPRQTRGDP